MCCSINSTHLNPALQVHADTVEYTHRDTVLDYGLNKNYTLRDIKENYMHLVFCPVPFLSTNFRLLFMHQV